jgi:ribonuclease G
VAAELLINRSPGETRVALVEEGAVRELYVERDDDRGVVGNIYLGRVTRVLPGMEAAFVDIGLDRAAFLYVDDIVRPGEEPTEAGDGSRERDVAIGQLLREGQAITVQVVKEPIGTKGARVTNYVTIPGRFVVYLPTMEKIGVSRKISDETERQRLREVLESLQKGGPTGGLIARTVCKDMSSEQLRPDVELVRAAWRQVSAKATASSPPILLMNDLDLVLRATRDLFTDSVDRLIIDSAEEAARVRELVSSYAPNLAARIEVAPEGEPLFDRYGIEAEIERALLRKIALKSGVTIVVDEAEALTAIDVNTGRFVGSRDLEATILKTNLEAAKAIAEQIRLRNLGGIIIVDFIDMEQPESRQEVFEVFVKELERDRARTHVLPITGVGLIQMTRQRLRTSLGRALTEPCPYCEGRGRVRSKATICHDALREAHRQAIAHTEGPILISAMPEVAAMLTEEHRAELLATERALGRSIVVEARGDLHQEVYQVAVRRSSSRDR